MELALIQCSSSKLNQSCKAEELYSKSTLFKASLNYCKTHYDEVCILSALHHLVKLDQQLDYYNLSLNDFNKNDLKIWSEETAKQILDNYPSLTKCHFYVGKNYRKYSIPILEKHNIECISHLDNLRIGEKVAWLQSHV